MSAQEEVNKPWRLLASLPSTNWKMVSGTLMTWAVVVFMFVLIWNVRGRDVLLGSLVDSLLMYSGVVAGAFPVAMFLGKRLTYKEGGPDDKRSTVTAAAAAADVAATDPDPDKP